MKFNWSLISVALVLFGCGQPDQEDASLQADSTQAEPAESADAFVARIRQERAESSDEPGPPVMRAIDSCKLEFAA